jgi:hypothetical protein
MRRDIIDGNQKFSQNFGFRWSSRFKPAAVAASTAD